MGWLSVMVLFWLFVVVVLVGVFVVVECCCV